MGGATVKETVWRILKQAIKNDLAKTISWRGLNGKVPFEKLHLRAVVTGKDYPAPMLTDFIVFIIIIVIVIIILLPD